MKLQMKLISLSVSVSLSLSLSFPLSASLYIKHLFYHSRWRTPIECHCQNRVRGKVVVITGATSGIGKFTALDLARKGVVLEGEQSRGCSQVCSVQPFFFLLFPFSKSISHLCVLRKQMFQKQILIKNPFGDIKLLCLLMAKSVIVEFVKLIYTLKQTITSLYISIDIEKSA